MSRILILALSALGLSACASLTPPSSDTLAAVPSIRYGQSAPADGDYILIYPAGLALPMEASITGDLFEADQHATLQPRLKQDVYVYKHWASFDGKQWARADKLVGGQFEIVLPGEKDGQSPGRMHAEFNRK